MKSEVEQEILCLLKENKEANEHAIVVARQSTPESLSPILQEIRNKINLHGEMLDRHIETHETDVKRIDAKLDEMKPKIDLIYPKVTGDIRKEEVWLQIKEMFKSGSGIILTVAATGAALVILLGWGKQGLMHWLKQ